MNTYYMLSTGYIKNEDGIVSTLRKVFPSSISNIVSSPCLYYPRKKDTAEFLGLL